MKSANEFLFEHGIATMFLNDDFNSQLFHAMERYAEEYHNEKSASLKPNKLTDSEIEKMAEEYGEENGERITKVHEYFTQDALKEGFIAGAQAIINKQK